MVGLADDGDAVGDEEGRMLVGGKLLDGLGLGRLEGREEGFFVGDLVGVSDGSKLGDSVGSMEGSAVGKLDGVLVGATRMGGAFLLVGTAEGARVGRQEGVGVEISEGAFVGTALGFMGPRDETFTVGSLEGR